MKNVMRLTEGAGTAFERQLLESALEDASPAGSMSRVASSLGLDLPATPLQEDGLREEGRAVAEAGLRRASSGALLKYTLIAIVCGSSGGSATSGAAVSNASLSNAALLASVPMAAESSELGSGEPVAALAVEPARTLADDVVPIPSSELKQPAPAVPSPRAARRPRAAPLPGARELDSRPSQISADGLLAEVQQLDRVRAALAAFQSQAALDELDDYDRRFPEGELALEAIVLRVQALRSAGQYAPATRLARHALELPGIERYRARLTRLIDVE